MKNDSEAFDEDPVPVSEPANGTLKGKKSRDDDAYRPKGGNSRSSKRKREDGEKNSRSKKPKLPMTGLDDQQDNKYNTRDGDYVQSAMDDGDT